MRYPCADRDHRRPPGSQPGPFAGQLGTWASFATPGSSSLTALSCHWATLSGSAKAPELLRQVIQRSLGPPCFVALEECADLVEVVGQREGQHPPRPPIALAVPAVCAEKAPEQGGIRAEGPEVDDHQVVVGVEQPNIVEVEHADRSDLARRSVDVHVARVQVTVGERRRGTVEDEGAGRGQEAVEVVQQVSRQDSPLTVLLRAASEASGEEARRLESTDRRLDPMHSPQEVAEKGRDTLTVHSDEAKLKSDRQSVQNQVLSKLTPDHQNAVNACLQAMAPRRSTTSGGASAQ